MLALVLAVVVSQGHAYDRSPDSYCSLGGCTMGGALTLSAGDITIANGESFQWASRGAITATGDGVFVLTDTAGTSFGRLALGGATASYPSWKRSGTQLQARLADDSGDAIVAALNFHASNNIFLTSSGLFGLGTNSSIKWTDNTSGGSGSAILGLEKPSPGVLKITNGTTGLGRLFQLALPQVTIAADDTTPDV